MEFKIGPPEFTPAVLTWALDSDIGVACVDLALKLGQLSLDLSKESYEKVDWPEIRWLDDRVENLKRLVGVDPLSPEARDLIIEVFRIASLVDELEHIPQSDLNNRDREIATKAAALIMYRTRA